MLIDYKEQWQKQEERNCQEALQVASRVPKVADNSEILKFGQVLDIFCRQKIQDQVMNWIQDVKKREDQRIMWRVFQDGGIGKAFAALNQGKIIKDK